MKNSPYKKWKWVTSLRDNVCPFCKPRHGKIFTINNKMERMPPDGSHPNCNCEAEVQKE